MSAKQIDLHEIGAKIRLMKEAAEDLNRMGDAFPFPALSRNMVRILASLKMLEMNISDVLDLDSP